MPTLLNRSFLVMLCLIGMFWAWDYQTSTITPCVLSQPQEEQKRDDSGDDYRCAGLYLVLIRPALITGFDFLADKATPISAVVTAIATAFIAWFTIALSRETRRMQTVADEQRKEMELARITMNEANKISRDSLATSQRAWLQPKVTLYKVNHNTMLLHPVIFYFKIEIENIGKSPATHVLCEQELIVYRFLRGDSVLSVRDTQLALSKLCKDPSPQWNYPREDVIFPGEIIDIQQGQPLEKERYDKIMSGAALQEEDGVSIPVAMPYTVEPTLVGCIDYRIPFSAEHHQTWFAYRVLLASGRHMSLRDLPLGDIPGDNFRVSDYRSSTKHAD